MSRPTVLQSTGTALGSAGTFKWVKDAPENRDAVTRGPDGPPDYGFYDSAAEFGLTITGELQHCCSFGAKSEFQEWLAGLAARPHGREDPRTSVCNRQTGSAQLHEIRQQLLRAEAAIPADAGIERDGARLTLQFSSSHSQPQAVATAIHARSFDTWMASHQPPADMRRVLRPPSQLCDSKPGEQRSGGKSASDAAISRTVHKLARRAPPASQAISMVQQLAGQHAPSNGSAASADAVTDTLSSGMAQALQDWVDGIEEPSQCCSISRPAVCWHCSREAPLQRDKAAGLRAAWAWLMAFVGSLHEHGAMDTVSVASATISHAMEAHAATPAVAALMMPLLRLQHACAGNVSSSDTVLPLLHVLCALQRLLAASLPAAAAGAAATPPTAATTPPTSIGKEDPSTVVNTTQLCSLLTAELPKQATSAGTVCVHCLRLAVCDVLGMAVAAVARAPEAAASKTISQQLLQILSSDTLVTAAGDILGDPSLPERARGAVSATLAVFREAAAATTVRKSVEVHMMYALQLHAPDAPAALNSLHRSIIDAGQLRRRGRSTLVRWVCDWACCPVLCLQPRRSDGRKPPPTACPKRRSAGARSNTPATPAVPAHVGSPASRADSWEQDAAVCVLPDVLCVARGWFAVRLLQLILAEEPLEQPEVDAWHVLMGTPSIHLGKGASLRTPEGLTPAQSRPGTPCILPPGTPATPAGGGTVDIAAAPLADGPADGPAAGADSAHTAAALQGALLDWMATSAVLGAAALTGEHGRTVAAFAVMLVEAGLLDTDGLAQHCFAEACASQPAGAPAAGPGSPSTPAARHAWFLQALDPRLARAIPPRQAPDGGSAGPSPPYSPVAAGPDSPAPPSSVSSPGSGPSQSRTASAEPLSVPPPAPVVPAAAVPPAAPPVPFEEWLAGAHRSTPADAAPAAAVGTPVLGTPPASAPGAVQKRPRPPHDSPAAPAAQVRKVSPSAAMPRAPSLSHRSPRSMATGATADVRAARAAGKVQELLWAGSNPSEAPRSAGACLARCRQLPPSHQRLVAAWLLSNLPCFAPPHLKPLAASMQTVSITAWLAVVKRSWWRASLDAQQKSTGLGRAAASARTRLPECPDADYLTAPTPYAGWLSDVVATLVALRADTYAAMLAGFATLRSMEHLATAPAPALLRLSCVLHALLPMLGTLGLALPLADAMRWAATRSVATATRSSTLRHTAALLSVALAAPTSAQDPTITTKPVIEKRLPANLPWARPPVAPAAPAGLHMRPPAAYQTPDAEAVSAVVQALQAAAAPEELVQAVSSDVEVAVSNAASGCGLEGVSAVFGVADVAVSAYATVVEAALVRDCELLLPLLLAAVASAADAALAAEEAAPPRPPLQAQLTCAVLHACCEALGGAACCTVGGAIADLLSAACGQGICDLAAATQHCLDAYHADTPSGKLHAAMLVAMHGGVTAPHSCVVCIGGGTHTPPPGKVASSCATERTLVPLLQRITPVDTLRGLTATAKGLLRVATREGSDASSLARAACNALLAAPALRLALFDAASHPSSSLAAHPAAAYACMSSLHFGQVVTAADAAVTDWRVVLARVLAQATPNRNAHIRPLLAAALEGPAAAAAADGGPAPQQQVVQVLVAALLRYEGCAPVAMTLALEAAAQPQKNAKSLHAAAVAALQRAIEAPQSAPLAQQARVLAGASIHSQELLAGLPDALVSSAGRRPPHIRTAALIDTCLVLLSRTDVHEWRGHARRLVQQVAHIADALHCICSAAEPPPAAADLVRELSREMLRSGSSHGLLQALWLRLELLMPVMPIVYHDTSQPVAANLRHCLACALVKLVAHSSALAAGAPASGGAAVARVVRRMVVLLQAVFSEQWSRWVVCHESRGSPKMTGRMLDQDGVAGVLKGVRLAPDVRARLESALPARIPLEHDVIRVQHVGLSPGVSEHHAAAVLCAPRFAQVA
eukprot:jgi/Ulvmu1/7378/UM036_0038.1